MASMAKPPRNSIQVDAKEHQVDVNVSENWLAVGRVIRKVYKTDPSNYPKLAAALAAIESEEARYMAAVMAACTKPLKDHPGGRAWRSTAPDRRKNLDAYLFHRAVSWYRGTTGGSLWGPIGDRSRWPEEAEKADTAAQIILVAVGVPMAALESWKKAIYG